MKRDPGSATAIAIAEFLDPSQPGVEQSCLAAALDDAARAEEKGIGWLSTLGYLVALEVLGKHIKRRRRDAGLKLAYESTRNAMESAMLDFAPEIEVQATKDLYALRCSIVHQFGLINHSQEPALRRVFRLESTGPVVRPARCAWDGDVDSSWQERHLTRVNIEAIPAFVNEVVDHARVAHRDGNVRLVKRMTIAKLRRFGMYRHWKSGDLPTPPFIADDGSECPNPAETP